MSAIERAARAVSEYMICGHCDGSCEDCTREARVVFESIDVDELARVIFGFPYADGASGTVRDSAALARAVRDYLLTGDENDE